MTNILIGVPYKPAPHLISKKYQKNNKNLSYCSNDDEKSISSKKRNSISGNTSALNYVSRNDDKVIIERSKMRSISSASTVKTFQSIHKKLNSGNKYTKIQAVKEYEVKEQVSNILKEVKPSVLYNKEVKEPVRFHPQPVLTPKGIDDTLSSIYSTIEENSVCNKRHDISVVEADTILDQINSRMIKLHFEMIYKNLDKVDNKNDDFSFEIDNTNNMIVPKNSSLPTKNKKFVQLPQREDLYTEQELSNGNLQWIADTQTIRIFPHSPTRNENASISSPFTSPQTNPRSPNGSLMTPGSTLAYSEKPMSSKNMKKAMYQYQ